MAKKKAKLQIYLFGASLGESIVLQLPNGGWAVIDCFASSPNNPQTNPAHKLLSAQGVSTLEFLCLTHPHEDHFMGMSRLIRDFQVKKFWGFGGLQPPDFDLLKTFFEVDAATDTNADSKEEGPRDIQHFRGDPGQGYFPSSGVSKNTYLSSVD